MKQRFPNVEVLIYPVKVQGAEAAGEIAQALDDLGAYPGVEVIVLARGGGSLEDLWPFNEESGGPGHPPLPNPGGLGGGPRSGFYHCRFCRGPAGSHPQRRGGAGGAG